MTHPPTLIQASANITRLMARAFPSVQRPGLLVALSGGPDSVALLLAAHHWSLATGSPLAAAHLNHQLRDDAAADMVFCQDLCASLKIPLHCTGKDIVALARLRGRGLEEAGRHAREEFFRGILEENSDLHCLAKGHHRNDQAETMVMRLFRGTGAEGLAGIRPVTGSTIYPLLGFTKVELLDALAAMEQPWRTDASNLAGDNTRSRLRRELMPLAREIFGEGCDLTPARLAGLMSTYLDFLEKCGEEAWLKLAHTDNEGTALAIAGLLEQPPALATRVLRRWLSQCCAIEPSNIEFAHVMNILVWLREGQSGTGLDLPQGVRICRQFDWLRPESPLAGVIPGLSPADYRILVQRNSRDHDPAALGLSEGPGRLDDEENWNLNCPANVLQGNLKIRNPRPGDRFQPFGLDGTRKLSDLFRDLRLPEARRQDVLLVEDEVGILWVVGLARSERTRLLPSTDKIVTICVARR